MAATSTKSPLLSALLLGGATSGIGDLLLAFMLYGFKVRVLQTIAAGLIGREAAYNGGTATVALGLALHLLIATIWTALYLMAARALPWLRQRALIAGALLGLVIFYGMNLVVLPLSALDSPAWPPPFSFGSVLGHMFLVGLPIALIVRKFSI